MVLQGKGFFINDLAQCEGGDPQAILAAAQAAGLSHVIVKIAVGEKPLGMDSSGNDLILPVARVLQTAAVAVWGWQAVFGKAPAQEAAVAVERVQALGLGGFVIVAGKEYEHPGRESTARQFMQIVREALKVPLALSSYRFPHFHPHFPWSTWLEFCDLHMPKVTWEQDHAAREQLRESRRQCDSLPNARPYLPVGPASHASTWHPTVQEVAEFMVAAQSLGLPAVDFYSWDGCKKSLPQIWSTIADFAWIVPENKARDLEQTILQEELFQAGYLAALNSRQPEKVAAFYSPEAISVMGDSISTGSSAIQTGFIKLFGRLPANTNFSLVSSVVVEDMYRFAWKVGIIRGVTTLIIKNGRIVQDYTFLK